MRDGNEGGACAWPTLLPAVWKAAGLAPVADVVNFAKPSHDIEMMRHTMIAHDFSGWAPDVVLVATTTNDDNAAKFSENNYAIVAAHVEDFVKDVGERVADCAGGTRPAFVFFEDSLAGLEGTVEDVKEIHLAQRVHERVAEETLSPVISWRDIMEPVFGKGATAARVDKVCKNSTHALCPAPRGDQTFNPTSTCAESNGVDRTLRPCFEGLTRENDSSKNQPNRLRCDRAREFRSLAPTSRQTGRFPRRPRAGLARRGVATGRGYQRAGFPPPHTPAVSRPRGDVHHDHARGRFAPRRRVRDAAAARAGARRAPASGKKADTCLACPFSWNADALDPSSFAGHEGWILDADHDKPGWRTTAAVEAGPLTTVGFPWPSKSRTKPELTVVYMVSYSAVWGEATIELLEGDSDGRAWIVRGAVVADARGTAHVSVFNIVTLPLPETPPTRKTALAAVRITLKEKGKFKVYTITVC